MDVRVLHRVAPVVYGVVVVLVALFASDAVAPVAIVGAVLLGLVYVIGAGGRTGGRQRDRRRRRA